MFTTVNVRNNNDLYYNLLKWIKDNKDIRFIRNFSWVKDSSDRKAMLTTAYGSFYMIYKKKLLHISRSVDSEPQVNVSYVQHTQKRETIVLSVLGRNVDLLKNIIEEITPKDELLYKDYTKYMVYKNDYWKLVLTSFKRPLNTVVIDKDVKNSLLNHVDTFLKNKEFYAKKGIAWKTGILLYGPPGTGKTSLIKALCGHYNKNFHVLSPSVLESNELQSAFNSLDEESIVVIEDIDSCKIIHKEQTPNAASLVEPGEKSFSDILNCLDGALSSEGRILIATTNHIEKLDEAFLRPGRFDLKLEIGYMTDQMFRDYMSNFYSISDLDKWYVKPNIAACYLQTFILQNLNNYNVVLEKFGYKKE